MNEKLESRFKDPAIISTNILTQNMWRGECLPIKNGETLLLEYIILFVFINCIPRKINNILIPELILDNWSIIIPCLLAI